MFAKVSGQFIQVHLLVQDELDALIENRTQPGVSDMFDMLQSESSVEFTCRSARIATGEELCLPGLQPVLRFAGILQCHV